MFGKSIVAAFLLAVAVPNAGAQHVSGDLRPGHFVNERAVAIGELRKSCLSLGDDVFAEGERRIGSCKPLGAVILGTAGDRAWISALFERRWLLSGGAAPADTVTEHELVLLSMDARPPQRDTVLIPVWHSRFEAEVLRSVTVDVAPSNDGGALFAIDECLNGTGGCSQTAFFSFRRNMWREVATPFLDSLDRRFPGRILHGFHVDVRALTGSAAVYGDGDANCCPSQFARLRLRLRNDSLQIVSVDLVRSVGGGR